MIMKRLMALLALASATALADHPGEGNIPAPDLFDSQITCSSNLPTTRPTPTVVPAGATGSPLDTAIGDGTSQILGTILVNNLIYVIPPGGSNCGQGTAMGAFTVANHGAVAVDLAAGYSDLLPKFTAVYGDPKVATSTGTAGALQRARDLLARAEADSTTPAATLTTLRATVDTALAADTAARAAFGEVTGGSVADAAANPIYAAAIAEWMAQSAVTQALGGYNAAIISATDELAAVNQLRFDTYTPLGNSDLITQVYTKTGGLNYARMLTYVNNDGTIAATVNAGRSLRRIGEQLRCVGADGCAEQARLRHHPRTDHEGNRRFHDSERSEFPQGGIGRAGSNIRRATRTCCW